MDKYHLTAVIWQEGKQYVSKCPELGVASCGRTPERARHALEEAVSLYLENAKQLGIIKDLEPVLSVRTHYTTSIEVTVP